MSDQELRIRSFTSKVVHILNEKFGHSEQASQSLFDAFHSQYVETGGWEPADYYDHEGPRAIALEIEFHHRFGERPGRKPEFLEWRKNQW